MWRTPEELVEIGFHRSRVVMMNEAHAGMMRCLRTRVIGQRILPTAHQLGVRYLALEALPLAVVEESNQGVAAFWTPAAHLICNTLFSVPNRSTLHMDVIIGISVAISRDLRVR